MGFSKAGLRALENSPEVRKLLEEAGQKVQDRARDLAHSIAPNRTDAVVADELSHDSDGPYVDVGYDQTDPGFVLWWAEVGTVDESPRPHLRPAASQKYF